MLNLRKLRALLVPGGALSRCRHHLVLPFRFNSAVLRLDVLEAAVVVFFQGALLGLFIVFVLLPTAAGGTIHLLNRFHQLTFSYWGGMDWAIVDYPAAIFLCAVFLVAQGTQTYSLSYLGGEPSLVRFVSVMFLFTTSMSILVCADSFFIFFAAWEAVGLCSFLLIGFWTSRQNATAAAMKAVTMNRVTDVFLFLGFAYAQKGASSVSFSQLGEFTLCDSTLGRLAALCFIFAACGKSAQVGFHAWLLTAMEGPTPVSAWMHAATLVTAGVILLIKASWAIMPLLWVALFVGVATAGFCGFAACFETDFKAIVAYSTSSQLGFMFMLVAAARNEAVFGHLANHAIFKALLFWAAGIFTHMYGGQYIYSKSAAWLAPLVCTALVVGSISLWGLPFTAGFYTKEYIVFLPLARAEFLWVLLVALSLFVQLCSIVYTARLLVVVVFEPAWRSATAARISAPVASAEVPLPIRVVLALASCLTLFVGRAINVETLALFQDTVFTAEFASAAVWFGGDFSWADKSAVVLHVILVVFAAVFTVSLAVAMWTRQRIVFGVKTVLKGAGLLCLRLWEWWWRCGAKWLWRVVCSVVRAICRLGGRCVRRVWRWLSS
jgi:NADH:ubiquinone oxidoreductase subunit 5 (subunit L)/multisubunit Na+/H+ antiporter MnhA subunit